ncbi:hypothetical protein [Leptothrix sp. BB-3]
MSSAPNSTPAANVTALPVAIGSVHRRRLRTLWQSAGWPCHDLIEAELLAAGLLLRVLDEQGRMTLHLSDAGVQELVRASEQNRRARSAHDGLATRVAATLAREGRLAWCGLSVRAPLPVSPDGPEVVAEPPDSVPGDLLDGLVEPVEPVEPAPRSPSRWPVVLPDVYSIRQTSAPGWLQPQVHEIKVTRADLLADLRLADKRAAYLAVAGAMYYVLAEGIGDADDVPPECGVLLARGQPREHAEAAGEPVVLDLLRLAPTRPLDLPGGLPFGVWMALARKTPQALPEEGQRGL